MINECSVLTQKNDCRVMINVISIVFMCSLTNAVLIIDL